MSQGGGVGLGASPLGNTGQGRAAAAKREWVMVTGCRSLTNQSSIQGSLVVQQSHQGPCLQGDPCECVGMGHGARGPLPWEGAQQRCGEGTHRVSKVTEASQTLHCLGVLKRESTGADQRQGLGSFQAVSLTPLADSGEQ